MTNRSKVVRMNKFKSARIRRVVQNLQTNHGNDGLGNFESQQKINLSKSQPGFLHLLTLLQKLSQQFRIIEGLLIHNEVFI